MWSLRGGARNLGLALGLTLALAVTSGCSFAPVYGENGVAEAALELNYAKPNNRLEQIVYQDLALRLGNEPLPNAPVVTVVVSSAARVLTRTATVNITPVYEMSAVGTVTVIKDGVLLANFSRTATAEYTPSGQVIANQQATTEAAERAAGSLAESIRLSLIAALAKR